MPAEPAPKFGMRNAEKVPGRSIQDPPPGPDVLLGQVQKSLAQEEAKSDDAPGVDKVTGLANKLLFAQHVQSTVSRMQADALTVSVSFIDLHGLNVQKEAVGSRVVNDYLFLLAKRLESTIRSIEIAGRIEGNILAIISINWLFAEDLPIVCQRLMGKLSEPLAGKDGMEILVPMNLGMAVAVQGEDVNSIFHRAWNSLQIAKARGVNEFEIDYAATLG
jgi:diguanylate cyclase (GGDEF)-like protein